MISNRNCSAVLIRMETPIPERLPLGPAFTLIKIEIPLFASSVLKGSFTTNFYAELYSQINNKMNSLGLNRCMVYLNSMAYDEKEGIRAEFSLFKSNTP